MTAFIVMTIITLVLTLAYVLHEWLFNFDQYEYNDPRYQRSYARSQGFAIALCVIWIGWGMMGRSL